MGSRVAVIMAGGNDLARSTCRLRTWLGSLQELVLGVLAAGATVVWIRAPAILVNFSPPEDFLGKDGVQLSAAGWRALEAVLRNVLAASAADI